jgi:tetratricopeptide (TPR) repeat protein
MDCYRTAIQNCSPCETAYLKLGDVFLRLGRLNDAMTCCQNALAVYPKSAAVYNQMGWIYACRGQVREAVNFFYQALSLDPHNVDARVNLAMALVALGQTVDAAAHFAEVLKTHPNHVRACSGLAWLRATAADHLVRKGDEAVELAERAADLTHRQDPDTLDVLAAAYAEAGQYDKAKEIAQQAITLATAQSKANLVFAYRNRLKLYEMNQPYREKLIPSATLPQDDFLSKDQLKH